MSEAEKVNSAPFAEWFNFANSGLADGEASPANQDETNLSESADDAAVARDVSVEPEPAVGSWSSVARWMDSAENGGASLTPEEVATLLSFIQEMRGSNTKLVERVIQLERALENSQNELHYIRGRSREADLKLAQKIQAQEQARSQVESLSAKLETAEQAIQQQKIVVETLTDDLNASQERIAQMERECSLVQSRYNEQSYQLMQVETSCRDLRSRLLRQQRYTMQLKVALEKCAESPAATTDRPPENHASSLRTQSLFPNPQPITPWSIQTPNFIDRDRQESSDSPLNEWTAENFLSDRQAPYSFNSTPSTGSFDLQSGNSSAEQSFFFSETNQEVDLDDFLSLLQEEASAEAIETDDTTSLDLDRLAPQPQISESHPTNESQTEEPAGEAEAAPADASPSSQNQVNLNWPSPVVYPWHPPKGRKSLASIELPKFPRRNQNQ
jgi:myosin heavy subunit